MSFQVVEDSQQQLDQMLEYYTKLFESDESFKSDFIRILIKDVRADYRGLFFDFKLKQNIDI